MESKQVVVKQKKLESTIDFYTSFGWLEVGEREEVGDKIVLNFERDKERLGESYQTIISAERTYRRIARPFPLAAIILFGIGALFLIAFFVTQKFFPYYIVFLPVGLTCLCISVHLLIIFLIVFLKRKKLLAKVVKDVAIDAGTIREYPLQNNIKEETDQTWLISSNLE